MAFKKLLLGAAAALGLAGSAHAADLYVAEPVDYVRICDAYGNTYWYSPGTNTCLSITGFVWAEVRVGGVQGGGGPFPTVAQPNVAGTYGWRFRTRASLAVTAKSSTEWGPLVGFLRIQATSDNNTGRPTAGFDGLYGLSEAYMSVGNFLAGYTGSIYSFLGNVPYRVTNSLGVLRLGNIDQFRYAWIARAWSLAVAVEDPRDRAGAAVVGAVAPSLATMAFPDVVAALAFGRAVAGNTSPFGIQLSAGAGARSTGLTFGAQLGAVWWITDRTAIQAVVAFSPNGPDFVAGINGQNGGTHSVLPYGGPGTYAAAQAGIDHRFSDRWAAGLTAGAAFGPGTPTVINAVLNVDFTPVENLTIRGEAAFNTTGGISGTVRFTRAF
jgi:hypothetical protein